MTPQEFILAGIQLRIIELKARRDACRNFILNRDLNLEAQLLDALELEEVLRS